MTRRTYAAAVARRRDRSMSVLALLLATVLGGAAGPVSLVLTVVAFVGLWVVGLVLIAVVCAWRAAIWTVAEATRKGTFGGSTDRRPGHWRLTRSSATLWLGRSLGRSRRRGEP